MTDRNNRQSRHQPDRNAARRHRRLGFEPLEDRSLLSIVGWTPIPSVHPSLLGSIAEFHGDAYFAGGAGTGDVELWKSDGTLAGTVLVKDIRPGATGSYPQNLVNVNGTLFFTADDGAHGIELWKSDGTAAGTAMVKDILSGSGGSSPYRPANINDTLFFSVGGPGNPGLWKSDGTAAGTVLVKDIGPADPTYTAHFTNVNGKIFFPGIDSVGGIELWKSDGTTAGTARVADLTPGLRSSYPRYLTNVGGKLFFGAAVNGSYGIWKSDGTAQGTTLVKTFSSSDPQSPSHPSSLVAAGGQVYFTLPETASSTNVWRSDGTAQGTVKAGGAGASHDLVAVGNTIYFFDGPADNQQLWKIEPGAAPALVKSVGMLPFFLGPVAVDNRLYFTANDGTHGLEVWQSDGTALGTALTIDARPGADSSTPDRLANIGGKLFFVANDGTNGRVLWASVNANDAPQFTKGADQSVTNLVGSVSLGNWATGISAGPPSQAGQTLSFQLDIDNPQLFAVPPSIDASGRLTYTPAAGAVGTATISVTLHDSGGTDNGGSDTSPPQTFAITIRAPGPRHNLAMPLDVTGDGQIVPGDALYVINYLNSGGAGPTDNVAGPPYYDTSGDDFVAPNDALLIINYINQFGAKSGGGGEGESLPASNPSGSAASSGDKIASVPALASWQLLVLAGPGNIELPGGKRRWGP
jgi:ELWxxDGT repeat protein